MKAIIFYEHGDIDKLKYEDVDTPSISPNEVLVRVKACGLNHLDLLIRSGNLGLEIPLPHITGSEIAGEVARVGSDVKNIKEGDRVVVDPWFRCGECINCFSGRDHLCSSSDIIGLFSNGGFAEYVRVSSRNIIPLPEGLDYNDGAAITLATLTAWHMLIKRAKVRLGETVLVLGAGSGVGSAAIQIAKLCGANVIAAAGSEEKLEKAKELGAAETINYKEKDYLKEVMRLTSNRGVDLVFEHIGSDTWEGSMGCLKRRGRIVTCGAHSGATVNLNLFHLFLNENTVLGSYGGTRSELLSILEMVKRGALRPVIYKTFPLKETKKAQKIMEERKQFGKIIINP